MRNFKSICFDFFFSPGTTLHPKTASSRLVLGCWWLFTVLVLSTYTASLAAILTVRVVPDSVQSIHDLAASADLRPVTVRGTNWWTLFMVSFSYDHKRNTKITF
jgi:hypothetical protein